MQAEAEYYAQMWAICDHFSSFQTQQQQSREEALWVAREAHHWALATAAALPHMGDARAIKVLSVTNTWGADSTLGVGGTLEVEGGIGVMECG